MAFPVQRYFSPLSVRSRFSPQRMMTAPPSGRRRVFPLVDLNPQISARSPSPIPLGPDDEQEAESEEASLLDEIKASF